ncbi:MAG: hypothetical protein PVSMB1_02840 [Gemmatimonadaceae bacterium]
MVETVSAIVNGARTGGLCLALSGGGFRATLFHLDALRGTCDGEARRKPPLVGSLLLYLEHLMCGGDVPGFCFLMIILARCPGFNRQNRGPPAQRL